MADKSAISRLFSNPYLLLGLGIVSLSFSPLFTHWAEAPGIVTSFYRMLISSAILLPFVMRIFKSDEKNKIIDLPFRQLIIPILAGVFSALDHSLWSSSIKQTSVANATLLNYISPLWVSFIAISVFKESSKSTTGWDFSLYSWVQFLFTNIINSDVRF